MHEIKKTGVEWLPEISKDFSVGYVKQYFNISKDLSNEGEPERVLKLARSGIVEKDVTTNEGQMAASYAGYNKVLAGDLLLNPMDLYSGANCNVSQLDGVISPAYLNLRAKKTQTVDPKFYDYYFKTQYWTMAMFAHGKGVSFDNRWTLNNDSLRSYEIPVLPYLSQKRIVQKIQSKEQNVDALIANQQAQIEKLKQYKQSLITEVVTKGLNPDVPMKDSGVEWIGMISVIHNIYRLKYLLNSQMLYGANEAGSFYTNNAVRYIRITDITEDNKLKDSSENLYLSIEKAKPYILKDKDVLFARSGATVGKAFMYLNEYGKSAFAGYLIKAECNTQRLLPEYLFYYTQSSLYEYWKNMIFIQATIQNIGANKYSNMPIIQMSLDEQSQIVKFLDDKCAKIDRLITIKQEKIDKLNDYKKSLIYEYVTGKKEA